MGSNDPNLPFYTMHYILWFQKLQTEHNARFLLGGGTFHVFTVCANVVVDQEQHKDCTNTIFHVSI